MAKIYVIKKYIKNLDYSAGVYVGMRNIAYKDKDKANKRKDELNAKSYNYVYKVAELELM